MTHNIALIRRTRCLACLPARPNGNRGPKALGTLTLPLGEALGAVGAGGMLIGEVEWKWLQSTAAPSLEEATLPLGVALVPGSTTGRKAWPHCSPAGRETGCKHVCREGDGSICSDRTCIRNARQPGGR